MSLARQSSSFSSTLPLETFRLARDVIQTEAAALQTLAENLPADFADAVQLVLTCQGSVIVTGMGKAGWIGQKISATMASTGTRSHYVHPSEAMHGDLGRIGPRDIVLVLSNSGETGEVLQLLPTFEKTQIPLIAIVGKSTCSLANAADCVLTYGTVNEACPLGLAPSTSTSLMLAMGDALALVVSRQKGFRPIDFAQFHPGGSLGRKLSSIADVMRPIQDCRVANDSQAVRTAMIDSQNGMRRSGAMLLVDEQGKLTGIFTDSDLAKLLESGQQDWLDQPVYQVMTRDPKTVSANCKTQIAVDLLAKHNISELPVVDGYDRPVGMVDITDVLNLLPRK